MPEGDTLHRAARRLQVLVGERLEVESPHPRAQAERVAEQIDGRRLESVEASGKNLVLRFEGGVVVRSHLRMTGRWAVRPRGERRVGRPWLVLRGSRAEGVLWNGPVLELHTRALGAARAGHPRARRRDFDAMLARMRRADATRRFGETLQDQTLVAGIGNMWMAESLWRARLSPWPRLADVPEGDRRLALETAARLMRAVRRRRPRAGQAGARPRRPPLPALPHADPLARPGRREPDGVLVPACQPGPDPERVPRRCRSAGRRRRPGRH